MPTLAELYCAARGLPADAFAATALRACLPLPARLLRAPLRLVAPDFFAADFDLINNAGWLTRPEDFDLDLEEYRYHPCNQSRLRRKLGLSISTTKLRRLVQRHLRRTPDRAPPPRPLPLSSLS